MIIELIQNLALLIALAVGLEMLVRRLIRWPWAYRVASGLLFGAVGVAGMMMPLRFAPGVIYDGRSIVLSLAGLFGGPLAALVAVLLCGAYRLHLGGDGALAGLLVIVESGALGVGLHYLRRRSEKWVQPVWLWVFGVVVHGGMMALQLVLPEGRGWEVLQQVGPAVMLLYPLGFVLVAQVLLMAERRAKAEEALRRSEERYRAYVENAPDGIFISNAAGEYIEVNQAACQMTGYSRRELLQMKIGDLAAPESSPEAAATFESVRTSGQGEGHVGLRRKDGVVIVVALKAVALEGQRFMAFCSDVTEHRRAESQLRERERLLSRSQAVAHLGSWELDQTTHTLTWSDEVYRILGLVPQSIRPSYEAFLDMVHAEDRAAVDEAFRESIAESRDHYEVEHRIIRQDTGEMRHVLERCDHVRGANGEIVKSIGMTQDITEAKRSQEALAESERRYRTLVEKAPVGIFTTTSNGRPVQINPEMATLVGCADTAEAMAHYSRIDQNLYLRPERRREFVEALQREGGVEGFEYEARTVDGRVIWLGMNARLSERQDDGTFLIEGFTYDITARKHAEQRLAESERTLSTLMGNLPGMAYRCRNDEFWTMEFVSQGAWQLTGYRPGELIGNSKVAYAELIHPDDRDRVNREIQAAVRDRRPFVLEYRIRDAGGAERWVWERGCGVFDEDGRARLLEGFIEDVTDRRRAMDALQENEERFRRLVEGGPDCIFVQTNERFAYLNRQALLLFGAEDPSQIEGQSVFERIHPRFHETVREQINAPGDATDRAAPVEEVYLKLDGTEVPVEVSAVAAEYGGEHGAIVFARDISARKRLEGQLAQARKMEAIGRLAGGVAHDFNNMLQTILGYSDLLLADAREGSEPWEHLTEIRQAARRSADLTGQLLAFARKQTIAPQVVDLNERVNGLLRMLERLIGEDIDLMWKPGRDVWPVRMDPSQLDQVLANLVVNSRDAIPGSGHVTIETSTVRLDKEYCEDHPGMVPGDYSLLVVSDDGVGMDTETLSQVFEPFFTTKSRDKGTGLGLATVYGIVKQNGGSIHVYSEPGQGTSVRIYLPRDKSGQDVVDRESQVRSRPGGTETILLVEDEEALLRLSRKMLERLGYQVLPAAGPTEAIHVLADYDGPLDLLMTDVIMPEKSGRELWNELRDLRPELRCVFMSGYTENVIAHHGVLEEGVHFLQKPFSPQDLAEKVRDALGPGGEAPAADPPAVDDRSGPFAAD